VHERPWTVAGVRIRVRILRTDDSIPARFFRTKRHRGSRLQPALRVVTPKKPAHTRAATKDRHQDHPVRFDERSADNRVAMAGNRKTSHGSPPGHLAPRRYRRDPSARRGTPTSPMPKTSPNAQTTSFAFHRPRGSRTVAQRFRPIAGHTAPR